MTKTVSSRRISSAIASRSASRTVVSTILILVGMSGSCLAVSAFGAGAAFGSGAGSDGTSGAAAVGATGALESAEASSPSSSSCRITVPTFTPSEPASTVILPTTPSSMLSTSIVALSVSISASMSPETTLSPSLTSHFVSVPSSMVGDRAGILISIAIM